MAGASASTPPAARGSRRRLAIALGGVCVGVACSFLWARGRGWEPARALALCRATGWVGAVSLLLTLLASPLARVAPGVRQWRRPLGLATAFAATLHAFASLFGPLEDAWRAAWSWPSFRSGLVAWIVLLVLALTSWSRVIRVLHLRHWKELHRLVYVVALLVGLHVLGSSDAPVWAGVALVALLAGSLFARLRTSR